MKHLIWLFQPEEQQEEEATDKDGDEEGEEGIFNRIQRYEIRSIMLQRLHFKPLYFLCFLKYFKISKIETELQYEFTVVW